MEVNRNSKLSYFSKDHPKEDTNPLLDGKSSPLMTK